MNIVSPQAQYVLTHPGAFALQTLKAFKANQGLLLAGQWLTTHCSPSCPC